MATKLYELLDEHFHQLRLDDSKCVVEIGSERGQGSTAYLSDWTRAHGLEFHTVDVTNEAQVFFDSNAAVSGKGNINFHVVDHGHRWCRDVLPGIGKHIAVLYLDNFDWIYTGKQHDYWVRRQIAQYALRGVVMNNANSQEEHRLQVLHCLPHMAPASVVLMDDTFEDGNSPGGWNGKCGTAIPHMIEAGYELARAGQGMVCYRGLEFAGGHPLAD